jgi:hypothetical protein
MELTTIRANDLAVCEMVARGGDPKQIPSFAQIDYQRYYK